MSRNSRKADRIDRKLRRMPAPKWRPLVEALEDRLVLANWSGVIPDGTVWSNTELQQIVGDCLVPAGATLVIQPGAQIKADIDRAYRITVDGTLLAQGTASQPILLTSIRDDSGADAILGTADDVDSNNDGSSAGDRGDWAGFTFTASSTGSVLEYVDLRFTGAQAIPGILVTGAELSLRNSVISHSLSDGMRIEASNPTVAGVTFLDNSRDAMSMDLSSNPAVNNVSFVNNRTNGLVVDAGELPQDAVWDDPDVVYVPLGLVVPQGRTLTVAAGQIIKPTNFVFDLDLIVAGKLLVNGTAEKPVIITSRYDETVGGVTFNNDNQNVPRPGDWGEVRFTTTSTGSRLSHCVVRYGGGSTNTQMLVDGGELTLEDSVIRDSRANGLDVRNHAVTIRNTTFLDNGLRGVILQHSDALIENCTFTGNRSIGVRIEDSTPVLTGNRFLNNVQAAVSMNLASDPAITDVTLINNGVNGLQVDPGQLVKDTTWNDPDITYLLNGFDPIVIPAGTTLTIGAGQIVKVNSLQINVAGRLLTHGSASRPVIFTSGQDDTVGGDTDNYGPTTGTRGAWSGINFEPTSAGNLVEYTDIRFGFGVQHDGQLFLDATDLIVRNSTIQIGDSNGIYVRGDAELLVENCLIYDHVGFSLQASGIWVDGGRVHVSNTTIDGNRRGVRVNGGTVTIVNSLITNNLRSGASVFEDGTLDVRFSDVYNPGATEGNYQGLTDPTGTNGNLAVDPRYQSRVSGNFELRGGSAAIDAGSANDASTTDRQGRSRFDDPDVINRGAGSILFVDLGAFERQDKSGTPTIDLAASDVAAPAAGLQDEEITVAWSVKNVGADEALGAWSDAIYLSADLIWTPDDLLLGQVLHGGGLAPGASYNGSAQVKLPGVLPGHYHILVLANADQSIFEGSLLGNNFASSLRPIRLDVPTLVLGTPLTGSLTTTGAGKIFKLQATAGLDLGVTLSGAADAVHELYIKMGEPPTRSSFDVRAAVPNSPNQAVSIGNAQAGTYFVLVFGASIPAPESFTLTAMSSEFGIQSVSPTRGANVGRVTVTIEGAQFNSDSKARLIDSTGAAHEAAAVQWLDSRHITATFNLATLPAGAASIQVFQGAGPVATLSDAFTIVAGGSSRIQATVASPSESVRLGRPFPITIEYANTGDVDIPAPVLILTSTGIDELSFTRDMEGASNELMLVGVNPNGPAGVLPPGARGRLTVYGRGLSDGTEVFNLFAAEYPQTPIDWMTLGPQIRPPGISDAEWNPVLARLRSQIGDSWSGYVAALSAAATALGPNVYAYADVFAHEVALARAALHTTVTGRLFLTDALHPLSRGDLTLVADVGGEAFDGAPQSDGKFLFIDVPDGVYTLQVDGFLSPAPIKVTVAGASVNMGNVVVQAGGAIAGGVVQSSEGIPVREAAVTAQSAAGAVFTTTTDLDGVFRFDGLPDGVYVVSVLSDKHTGGQVANVVVAAGGPAARASLQVHAAGAISGSLVGLPATIPPGASVYATDAAGVIWGADEPAANGAFHITGLPAGLYSVSAFVPGKLAATVAGVQVTAGFTANAAPVQLTPAGAIHGTVTLPPSSPLLAPGRVTFTLVGRPDITVALEADLSFTAPTLAPGNYTLTAILPGFLTIVRQALVTAGATTNVNLSASLGSTISGLVTNSAGQPVPDSEVTLIDSHGHASTLRTDATGRYRFAALNIGRYAVFSGTLVEPLGNSQAVTTTEAAPDSVINLTLPSFFTLTGVVFASNGVTGLANAEVTLFQNGVRVTAAPTDAQGAYSIKLLEPGAFDVIATSAGSVFAPSSLTLSAATPQATLNFIAGTATLSGTARFADAGAPVAEGDVYVLQKAGGIRTLVATAKTDSNGDYSLAGLAAGGDYEIVFSKAGFGVASKSFRAGSGSQSTDFDLFSDRTISGSVSVTSTGSLEGIPVVVLDSLTKAPVGETVTTTGGGYQIDGLAPGSYDILVGGGRFQQVVGQFQIGNLTPPTISLDTVVLSPDNTGVEGTITVDVFDEIRSLFTDSFILGDIRGTVITVIDSEGRVRARTSPDFGGKYAINGLPPDDYKILISNPNSEPSIENLRIQAGRITITNKSLFFLAPERKDNFITRAIDLAVKKYEELSGQAFDALLEYFTEPVQRLSDHPFDVPLPAEGCEDEYRAALEAVRNADAKFKEWQDAQINYNPTAGRIEQALNGLVLAKDIAAKMAPYSVAVKKAFDFVKSLTDWPTNQLKKFEDIKKLLEQKAIVDHIKDAMLAANAVVESMNQPEPSGADVALKVNALALAEIAVLEDLAELNKGLKALLPGAAFLKSILEPVSEAVDLLEKAFEAYQKNTQITLNLADQLVRHQLAERAYRDAVKRANQKLAILNECNRDHLKLPPPPPPKRATMSSSTTTNATSMDPNDLIGPAGFGPEGFIQPGVMPFVVQFENDPEKATAAAQVVVITLTLDANLDLSTLEFTGFGFGNREFDLAPGLQLFQKTLDLRDEKDLLVPVSLELNHATRTITITLSSLDPTTLLAPDGVNDGVLPINNANHDGEGYVRFIVSPLADLPSGTVIQGQASIVFDQNEAILTPVATNTLDIGAPTSTVAALPATTTGPSFTVSWSGSDDLNGSGIAHYDIFVSDNNGPFTLWQNHTTQTSASFMGVVGHTYRFYSVASDHVGLQQPTPATAQATTTLQERQNSVPVVNFSGNTVLNKGTTYTATGSFADPDAQTWTATVDYGDGGSPQNLVLSPTKTFALSHTYTTAGQFSVTVTVRDSAGATDSRRATVTVNETTQTSTSLLRLSSAVIRTPRNAPTVALTVIRNGSTAESVTVTFTTSDGSAVAGSDYQAATGTLTLDKGELARSFTVALNNDGSTNGDENFFITLSDPTGGAALLQPLRALVVLNDPLPPETIPTNLIDVAFTLTHADESFAWFIREAYFFYLGRQAEADGLNYWIDRMQAGLTDEMLESGFLASPEYITNHGGTGAGWVNGMYFDLLGRQADPQGLAFWIDKLNQGAKPFDIAFGFAASAEREGLRIEADYFIFLGRQLDPQGKAFWVQQFLNGARNEDVVAGFIGSKEYFENLGKGQNRRTAWIRSAYRDIYHRDPSDGEIEYWNTVFR